MKVTDTPWGFADQVKVISPGITSVSTPGHGGLHVADSLLAKMPRELAASNSYSGAGSPWFEEDCEWALVCLAFPGAFDARSCHYAVATVSRYGKSKPGEYFHSAAAWLAGPAGEAVKSKAAQWQEREGVAATGHHSRTLG